MKKCIQCGRESMDSAKFCESCGARFPDETGINESAAMSSVNISNDAPPLPDYTQNTSNTSGNDYSYTNQPPANNGLVWLIISSIMTLLCCCIGVGLLQVPTIITSAISVSRHKNGDYESAQKMSKISMILFFSLLGLMILITVLMFVTQSANGFDYSYFEDFAEGYY